MTSDVSVHVSGGGAEGRIQGQGPWNSISVTPLGVLPSSLLRPLPFSEWILQTGWRNTSQTSSVATKPPWSCGHAINGSWTSLEFPGRSWVTGGWSLTLPPNSVQVSNDPVVRKDPAGPPHFPRGLQGGRPLIWRGFLAQFSYIRFVVGSTQGPACRAISSFMPLRSDRLFWEGLFGTLGMKICLKPWAHAFHRWDFVRWTVIIYKKQLPIFPGMSLFERRLLGMHNCDLQQNKWWWLLSWKRWRDIHRYYL